MRGLRVASGTHLDVAEDTVDALGFRVDELPVVASGAVLEHFVTVLHWGHLLQLETQDPLVLLFTEQCLD